MDPSESSTEDAAISLFRGDHAFLSNFHPIAISWEGLTYPTVEHAFQAAKTFDAAERQKVQAASSPTMAKRQGRKVQLREDWESVKLEIMKELLRVKFSDPALKEAILSTGQRELIEGNNWNDRYWGVCRGKGRNHLGRLLMEVREEIGTE